MTGKVNWYGDKVMAVLKDAADEVLTAAALQTEAVAKVNITTNDQVDTGFMRASVYVIEVGGKFDRSGVMVTGKLTGAKSGATSVHETAPVIPVPDDCAAVHVAANYALYQEVKKPFLYPAVKSVTRMMGGVIRKVAKECSLD